MSAPRISEHPAARRQIARLRAWGAFIGFAAAFWLSHRAGLSFPAAGMRAIVAGAVCRVAVWAVAVTLWRHLIPAEIEQARLRRVAAAQEAAERMRATREARAR